MSNYSSNLKSWGSTGSEYPNGYNYVEGEQPVDGWDNYVNYNAIEDLLHLINLTNDRIETDSGSYTNRPSTPETSHLYFNTTDYRLEFFDANNSVWHGLVNVTGDTMQGALDMGGYQLKDSTGPLTIPGDVEVNGASIDTERYSKYEGGTVAAGESVPLRTVELADGETFSVTEAHLSDDGFTTAAASGIDLTIVAQNGTNVTVLSGDGSTLHTQVTGAPVASYTNTTGSAEVVMVAIDNGDYNTGTGNNTQAFGGFIARIN